MSRLVVEALEGGYTHADSILKGVAFVAEPGRIATVIGPNGAGKSTLLKAIAGLIHVRGGRIDYDGTDLVGMAPGRIAARGIGFVPQEANVFGSLSVEENLDMAGWLEPKATKGRMREIYDRFPILAERRRQRADSLSGGQKQTLAMAMALMTRPRLLLLDEPSAGLSPKAAADLLDTIRGIRDDGIGIALVEQNAVKALEIGDTGWLLVDGRTARTAPAAEMLADPEVRRMFLGGPVETPASHPASTTNQPTGGMP